MKYINHTKPPVQNVRLEGNTLVWDQVAGANKYYIRLSYVDENSGIAMTVVDTVFEPRYKPNGSPYKAFIAAMQDAVGHTVYIPHTDWYKHEVFA